MGQLMGHDCTPLIIIDPIHHILSTSAERTSFGGHGYAPIEDTGVDGGNFKLPEEIDKRQEVDGQASVVSSSVGNQCRISAALTENINRPPRRRQVAEWYFSHSRCSKRAMLLLCTLDEDVKSSQGCQMAFKLSPANKLKAKALHCLCA
jgi:hypothetical protein